MSTSCSNSNPEVGSSQWHTMHLKKSKMPGNNNINNNNSKQHSQLVAAEGHCPQHPFVQLQRISNRTGLWVPLLEHCPVCTAEDDDESVDSVENDKFDGNGSGGIKPRVNSSKPQQGSSKSTAAAASMASPSSSSSASISLVKQIMQEQQRLIELKKNTSSSSSSSRQYQQILYTQNCNSNYGNTTTSRSTSDNIDTTIQTTVCQRQCQLQ